MQSKRSIFGIINKSLKNKIIFPIVAVLIILVIFMSYYLSVKFLDYCYALIDEKIDASINSLDFYIKESGYRTKLAAISMSMNPDARKAIKARDREEILQIFSQNIDKYMVNYFTITDNKGVSLARTHQPDTYGDELGHQQNVKEALNGRAASYFEAGNISSVKLSSRASAPIYDTDGTLIGVIIAGIRFDTDLAVDGLKDFLRSDISIYMGDTRIATTIRKNGERITQTKMDPDIAKIVLEGKKQYIGNVNILGENYKACYKPLFNKNGEIFVTFFIGNPVVELRRTTNLLIINGIIIGVIGLAVSIALMYLIISRLIKPVNALSKQMDDIAIGNMNVDIAIKSEDEVGNLSASIKKVIDIFNELIKDVNVMIEEHNKGNAHYRIDLDNFQGDYKTLALNILKLADTGIIDHLTGLPNRRSFDSRLKWELNNAKRNKTHISILMLDLDKFKDYNDAFGHQQGDIALQEVAKVLTHCIKREVDFMARWGGEEFVVLLPHINSSNALNMAELIRSTIEKTQIPCTNKKASSITVSIGVNTQIPAIDCDCESLVLKADEALYRAKTTGRNRVAG